MPLPIPAYVVWYDHDGRMLGAACLLMNPAYSMRGAHRTLMEAHPDRGSTRYRIYEHEWFHLEELV